MNGRKATPEQKRISRAYSDLLGRAPDDQGAKFFDNQMAQGVSPAEAARDIVFAREYREGIVRRLYQRMLGRDAEDGGLAFHVEFLASGHTVEEVEGNILASAEYLQRHGGTALGFVTAVYHDALGRDIDPAGQTFYLALLDQGTSRSDVARLILTSDEARQHTVKQFYQRLLHREAEPGGLGYWVGVLENGTPQELVIAAIVGSEEYGGLAS